MREIQAQQITDVVEKLCIEANQYLPGDVQGAIRQCRACEDWEIAQGVLDKIITNFEIAENENVREWRAYSLRLARMCTLWAEICQRQSMRECAADIRTVISENLS